MESICIRAYFIDGSGIWGISTISTLKVARHLGTGHYLWPGGDRVQKWGGIENILSVREWASKKY